MATPTKLVLTFANSENGTTRFSYNYANPEVVTSDVKALVAGLITNTDIFEKTLVSAKSAVIVTTTETNIDIVN